MNQRNRHFPKVNFSNCNKISLRSHEVLSVFNKKIRTVVHLQHPQRLHWTILLFKVKITTPPHDLQTVNKHKMREILIWERTTRRKNSIFWNPNCWKTSYLSLTIDRSERCVWKWMMLSVPHWEIRNQVFFV